MADFAKRGSNARWSAAVGLVPLLVVVGCSSSSNPGRNEAAPNSAATAEAPTPVPVAKPAAPSTPVSRVETTDLLEFSYTFPGLDVPEVAALLTGRADAAKAKALAGARQDHQAATTSGFPYHAHEYHADWSIAAETPRLLSMVATVYTYTGGAHGMTVFEPLLWDKKAGRAIEVAALFTDHAMMETALHEPFCTALDRERARKRGAPVERSDDPFTACIDPAKEVIVPTASGAGAIDGLTVYVAPYDAGPYAEGAYQVTLPVDAALLKAITPGWRDAFAVAR